MNYISALIVEANLRSVSDKHETTATSGATKNQKTKEWQGDAERNEHSASDKHETTATNGATRNQKTKDWQGERNEHSASHYEGWRCTN